MMVDITNFVDCNPRELGVTELVYYPVLAQILEEYSGQPQELAAAIKRNIYEMRIFWLLSITISIWNMESAMRTILIILVTDVFVQ